MVAALKTEARAEQRRAARANIHLAVDIFANHTVATALSLDLSEGGAFVATHERLPIGAVVVVHMTLPMEEDPLILLAEVCWARPYSADESRPPGLGLQFVANDPSATSKLRALVELMRDD